MQTWPTKKLGIYSLIITLGVVVVVSIFEFPDLSSQFNVLALILTLGVLLWYAHDTNRIANEAVSQTELEMRPIMCLYVRYISGITDEGKSRKIKQYALTHHTDKGLAFSDYYFAVRNMGNGPAFNVSVDSGKFKVEKYQTRFFAPKTDEHAIKIIKKPNDKIRNLDELNGEVFVIECQSVFGKNYRYKYRVKNIVDREIEYISERILKR